MSTREHLDLNAMVGDLAIPCEALRHAGEESARWIVWQHACCPNRPETGLICNACLCSYLYSDHPVRCPDCGHRTLTARAVIRRYEPLNLPSAVDG